MIAPETLTLTAADAHRFDAGVYVSAAAKPPILAFYAALGTPGKVYRAFASTMAEHGVTVCTLRRYRLRSLLVAQELTTCRAKSGNMDTPTRNCIGLSLNITSIYDSYVGKRSSTRKIGFPD